MFFSCFLCFSYFRFLKLRFKKSSKKALSMRFYALTNKKQPVLKTGGFLRYSSFGSSILTLRRFLTASVRRYSICPFIERKSSSAQREISSHKVGESRSKSCFLSFSAKRLPPPFDCFLSFKISKLNRCLRWAGRRCFRKEQQEGWKPSALCVPRPYQRPYPGQDVQAPFQPCLRRRQQ